jgi:hypothetical protein
MRDSPEGWREWTIDNSTNRSRIGQLVAFEKPPLQTAW